ncbi:MAG: DNA-protecting protein DprA [Planctomycetes bacterium]|nr:DNA-protecting protein DprA [Planctomycetota bacterium]
MSDAAGMSESQRLEVMLRLSLTPGLGPVLTARVLEALGPQRALTATPADLKRVQGIGESKAASIAAGLRAAEELAKAEQTQAASMGIRILAKGGDGYPPLLASLPDAPAVLYVRGVLHNEEQDRYPLAIVGSRQCSSYGMEQSQRFAGMLARSGITIVSGGARGIDSAAHRGAIAAGGRTIAVLGCGLAQCYPPENARLFDEIAAAGAVVSELPLNTPPQADNFPARNRIISGLSLGVLVIEAGERSGALITARQAAEDHGREVFALPGRVDAPGSRGTLDLIKSGGASLVTDPADVIQLLESAAHHHFRGTHAARFPAKSPDPESETEPKPDGLFPPTAPPAIGLTEPQRKILEALADPLTLDDLCEVTGLDPAMLRREITLLEINKRVRREAGRLARR